MAQLLLYFNALSMLYLGLFFLCIFLNKSLSIFSQNQLDLLLRVVNYRLFLESVLELFVNLAA